MGTYNHMKTLKIKANKKSKKIKRSTTYLKMSLLTLRY